VKPSIAPSAVYAAVLVAAFGALPFLGANDYVLGIAIQALVYAVVAGAFNLVWGYGGMLSFAQLAFWGIGGYCTALTVMTFGGNFWIGMVLAAVLNAALALLIGFASLRLNRHAFVIVTLAFTLLATLVARDWVTLTKGPLGIPGLPAPELFGFSFRGTANFYWLAFGFAILGLGFLHALQTSRIGRTLRTIRLNEVLARSQGVSPMPCKLLAFAIGAALTGMAGGLFVFHLKIVDPLIFDFWYLQTFLIMVIVGGLGSFWGVLFAAIAVAILPEALRFSNELRMVLYGGLLVLAVLVMPRGIAGWLESRRVQRVRAAFREG
jgi:ABC-type branched-subunit amino acid transport system permease subunit